jgi:hypothetical protein
MALKSIDIPHKNLKEAFDTLTRLGLTAGPDATVDIDGTIHILPATCDRLVEAHIKQRGTTPPPPEPLATMPPPHRHDRRVHLPQWAELKLLQRHRAFLAAVNDAGDDAAKASRALEDWQAYRRRLRLSIIHDYAQGDVVHGNTYCYGGDLQGATRLDNPTGEVIRCDRLIHYTHPINPEDLALREANVWCAEVYRYHIPGLDDAPWMAQNSPRYALDAPAYRDLLLARATL